jgi:hypothetical protein
VITRHIRKRPLNVWLWLAVALYVCNVVGWFAWAIAKQLGGTA